MKRKQKHKKGFNTLNHSIPLSAEEILQLRSERKESVALINKLRQLK